MRVATCESELGGANPPELFSAPASGPPMAPAMTTNTSVAIRVRRGRALRVCASERSMRPIVWALWRVHNRPGDVSLGPGYSRGCTPVGRIRRPAFREKHRFAPEVWHEMHV